MLDITLVNVVTGVVVTLSIVLAVVAIVLVDVVIVPTTEAVVSMPLLVSVLGLRLVIVFETSLGWAVAGLLWLPLVSLVLDGGSLLVVGSGVMLLFLLDVLCGSGGKVILLLCRCKHVSSKKLASLKIASFSLYESW